MISHKGYTGSLEIDAEDDLITGVVLGTTDVITFQGKTVAEARKSFVESVDFCLELCAKRGKTPETPCSGTFVVRISPELHRTLALTAEARRMSLNDLACEAFSLAVRPLATREAHDLAPVTAPAVGGIPGTTDFASEAPRSRPGRSGRVRKQSGATG